MCVSANVNFAASIGIAAVGVATLSHVRQPRAVLFAVIPLLFALHQFVEGFVWLGMNHEIRPEATSNVAFLFVLYAQGILPLLMPLAVLLMEPQGPRKRLIAALTALGAGLCAYILYAVVAFPTTVTVRGHSLVYANVASETVWSGSVYAIVTCGSLLLSSHRVVRWFGVLNVVGLVATLLVKGYAVTSIWCAYAALVSVVLYWQFSAKHIDVERPNSRLAGLQPSF